MVDTDDKANGKGLNRETAADASVVVEADLCFAPSRETSRGVFRCTKPVGHEGEHRCKGASWDVFTSDAVTETRMHVAAVRAAINERDLQAVDSLEWLAGKVSSGYHVALDAALAQEIGELISLIYSWPRDAIEPLSAAVQSIDSHLQDLCDEWAMNP